MTIPPSEPGDPRAARLFDADCRDVEERLALAGRVCALARREGLDARAAAELGLCTAELLSNAIRHAGGRAHLALDRSPAPVAGVKLTVTDAGPGIGDLEAAFRDGHSRGRLREPGTPAVRGLGLGVGLGAVRRLADALAIDTLPGQGTRVVVWKLGPTGRGSVD